MIKSYKNINDLIYAAFDYVESKCEFTSIIVPNKYVRDIVNSIISDYAVNIRYILIDADYTDEYAISIDENSSLWVEPIKDLKEYNNTEADYMFVYEDIPSSFMNYQNENCKYEIFEFSEENCNCKCCSCDDCDKEETKDDEKLTHKGVDLIENEKGDICGFSISSSDDNCFSHLSYYSSENIDADAVIDLITKLSSCVFE